jgi:hypothetical protein
VVWLFQRAAVAALGGVGGGGRAMKNSTSISGG